MSRARWAWLLAVPLLLAGCDALEPEDRDVVAFLLADAGSERFTQLDQPAFAAALEDACGECVQLTRDARGDEATQARQLSEALESGADVVVLDPVAPEAAADLVRRAGRVPVVAYDDAVAGAAHLVASDPERTSAGVAGAVARQVPPGPVELLLLGGPLPGRVAEALGSRARVLAELPAEAGPRAWTAAQARIFGDRVDAVVAADDALAAEAAAGLGDAGVPLARRPVVTGHDGGLDAVRRLVTGAQDATVHVARAEQAERAARVAVDLLRGRSPGSGESSEPSGSPEPSESPAPSASDDPDPSGETQPSATPTPGRPVVVDGVPATLVAPVVITLGNLPDTVLRTGLYSARQICTPYVLRRCEELGLR